MTKEEKNLLIKDLCGRLPYGVKIKFDSIIKETVFSISELGYLFGFNHDIIPYLRPMSSMTEEELKELWESFAVTLKMDLRTVVQGDYKCFDWLNKHHFDYRGLIEKGLALEAPEGMYQTATNK